ncbi:sialate O-acetylesterase [Adhaeretor mobilis]|uniref:Periplasmic beta-glucosidase n=1 Tax=Adhaeretor mobilis TaxID=1930276 RepID=A0A517N1A1_9BACT|nr:sialate O-acetylesterase [Adhaeretor mobilis]QDT00919.1 Periplasmic beta-glucosidase precursor [Adhaeretor mobilis]
MRFPILPVYEGRSARTTSLATVVWVLFVMACSAGFAQEDQHSGLPEDISQEQFHVYLLVGQSNMSGRGEMSPEDRNPKRGIYALDANDQWKPASHPLHFDKPKIARYGLGIEFAEQMQAQDETLSIGLVPCAVGGTSLKEWSQGGKLYASAIARAKLAAKRGTLKGILWHQGEGDCRESKALTYRKRLTKLIGDLRADLGSPGLPFVLGELGHFRVGKKSRSDIVIQQQRSIPTHVDNTACVSAIDLGHVGDYSHFDAAALKTFGTRFATAMQSLQSSANEGDVLAPREASLYHQGWIDLNKNGKRDTYEDSTASIDARTEDLLSQMNVNEKTCQLVTLYGYKRVVKDDLPTPKWKESIWKDGLANIDEHINGIAGWRGDKESEYLWPPSKHARAINEVQRWFLEETRLGIPVEFTNEGIRGVCHHRATNFPAQVGIGATWNKQLAADIGRITGTEAKSLGYTNIYSPILDVARDPRWGRVVECYGEDPFLVGALGVQQARGLQNSGVASTAKHFAVYSVPKGGRDGKARTDPHVAPREMQQIYLAPFAEVIRDARILGIMSSYNDYDGIPVSGSSEMMIDILRKQLGFRGYVVSDSDAVKYLHSKHHVASSAKDAVRLFLESGGNVRTEFNSPKGFVLPLRELIEEKGISMDIVDDRVRDVLRVKFELGLFDNPYVANPKGGDGLVHSPLHRQTAIRAARESIVLLKNENQVLPLKKDLKSILVCGPNAKEIEHSISRYGPTGGEVVSILEGVQSAVSPDTVVHYAAGAETVDSRWPESEVLYEPPAGNDAKLIKEAVNLARDVDVIVAVLGESEDTIGESKSRTDLNLTGYQRELVQALHKTGKPIVVVLVNGRALSINWIDRNIPGIVEAWFPGEACGRAVADVLFGDYNPGGKLPVTFPRTVGQLPYNFPFKPGSQSGQGTGHNPNGKGSSRILGELYPFGFGLSYTEFTYGDLKITPEEIQPGESVEVTCRVTNAGDRAGDEVVQLYLRDELSSVTTYDSVLRGFERIHLAPGETKDVSFTIESRAMALLDRNMEWVVEPGDFAVLVGSSSQDIRLKGAFEVQASKE